MKRITDAEAARIMGAEPAPAKEKTPDPTTEELLASARAENEQLQARLDMTLGTYGSFLAEMYSIMVDPLADEEVTSAAMMKMLVAAAIQQRQQISDLMEVPVVEVAEVTVAAPGAFELSADDVSKLKVFMGEQTGVQRNPDGSVTLPVNVPAEMVPVIEEWAIGADQPFEEYMRSHILTCLTQGTIA